MKKSFEDKFKNQVKQAFDDHDPKFNPELWQDMKNRLTEKKSNKTVFIHFLRKTAAIWLLLIAFTGFMLIKFNFQTKSSEKISLIKSKTQESNSKSFENKNPNSKNLSPKKNPQSSKNNKRSSKHPNFKSQNSSYVKNTKTVKNTNSNIPKSNHVDSNLEDFPQTQSSISKIKNQTIFSTTKAKYDFSQLDSIIVYQHQSQDSKIDKNNTLNIGLAINISQNNTLRESVYHQNTGFGLGLMSDIPLRKKWALQTGLILIRQEWKSGKEQNQALALATPFVNNSGLNQDSKLSFWAIDLPLQVQHPIFEKNKIKILASAGFSSYWYLQEKNTVYEFGTTNVSVFDESSGTFTNQTVPVVLENTQTEYFSRFEAFRSFNFSLSLQYPLSKKFTLSIEPFTRFSLGKMTQKDLQLNTTGLQVRFNFLP